MANITTVKENEHAEWTALMKAFMEFASSTFPEESSTTMWSRIQDPNGDIRALVARDEDGKIVGLVHYRFLVDTRLPRLFCWMVDLWVDPASRRKGIGRALILAVAEEASEKGCKHMRWNMWHDNPPAQSLYDKLAISQYRQYNMSLPFTPNSTPAQ